MSTPGSMVMTIGLIVILVSVSAGMHSGGFSLLLCFVGVLIGANLLAVAVRVAEEPAAIVPVVFGGSRALVAFVRRHAAALGLVIASCAITAVSGEKDPVLCFGMFLLLLLGLTLIEIGAHGELL